MIAVQVGQAGNQLGFDLYDSLYNHLRYTDHKMHLNNFFREVNSGVSRKWVSRSVWLDTDPTTVDSCIHQSRQSRTWILDECATESRDIDVGGNWAKGYEGFIGEFRSNSIDHIRMELERVDLQTTLMVAHSVGGGAGSGIGTRVTEEIHDEFPDVSKMNLALMPSSQIEKVLQHYNSVMCLSKIAKATDAVLLFDNEVMTDLCLEMFDTQKPSFHDVNRAIVHNLVPALLPKYLAEYQSTASLHPASAHSTATSSAFRTYGRFSSETQRYWGRDHEERWRHVETERVEPTAPSSSPRKSIPLLHDISHLCGHPNYKFLDAKYVPQVSLSRYRAPSTNPLLQMSSESPDFGYRDWRQVLRSLQQMNLLGSASELCMSRNTVGTSAVFAGWSNDRPSLKFDSGNDYNMLYLQTMESFPSPASLTGTSSPAGRATSRPTSRPNKAQVGAGAVTVHSPLNSPSKLSPSRRLVRSLSFLDEGEFVEEGTDCDSDKGQCGFDAPGGAKDDERLSARVRNIASCLTLFGPGSQQASEDIDVRPIDSRDRSMEAASSRGLCFGALYESWVKRSYEKRTNPSSACAVRFSTIRANGYEQSASVLTNGQSIIPSLQRPVILGTKMFRVGAHVHQYTSAGVEEDDLVTAFRSVQTVVNNYRDLK